jgi:NAD(P)-dependent dehydrogenase (short-subunit alcohol dehydrogenase family)
MIERGGGSIIDNASMAGLGGEPGYGAYVVTKFAVVGLTKLLAAEFGDRNVRCNATCPGYSAWLHSTRNRSSQPTGSASSTRGSMRRGRWLFAST